MKIRIDDILDSALAILDQEGLAQLNMRAVAGRLNVRASALYWHVADKNQLLGLMATEIYRRPYVMAQGNSWSEWLKSFGQAFRATLLKYQDSAQLCAAVSPVGRDDMEFADRIADPLVSRGLDRGRALTCHAAVVAFTLGSVAFQQSRALHGHLLQMIDFDEVFSTGLSAMISGFEDK